jgi:GMP synthase (glutamine-hydrolysing)
VAVVQHTAVCPPGRVGQWLVADGCALEVFSCFAGQGLPSSLEGYGGLVVLGGEMGAYDDALHPWLSGTKALLAEAVAAEVPTLAICLGLQLLAVATGGRVAPSPAGPQLGVRPVEPTPAAADDPLVARLEPGALAVHWNNDLVVAVPPDGVVLATSDGGVQALRLGPAAWGVQHHPEVTVDTLRRWAEADVAAGVVDAATAELRLAEVERHDAALAEVWGGVVGRFAALLHASAPDQRAYRYPQAHGRAVDRGAAAP